MTALEKTSGTAMARPISAPLDFSPREVRYTLISVDDHLVEPPHMFEGRLPRRLQPDAPRVVTTADGHEAWTFDGTSHSQVASIRGWPGEEGLEPRAGHLHRDAPGLLASKSASMTWTSVASGPR